MNKPVSISPLMKEILNAIEELTGESNLGLARTIDICKKLKKSSDLIRNKLNYLKKAGLIENPLYAHWRLIHK